MDTVGAIAVLVLTPVLWILSHKFFRFIYFGNIGKSILKEILECFFISLLLVSVLGAVFGKILSFIGGALLVVLKIVLIVAVISLVAWLISVIVKKVKEKKTDNANAGEIENLTNNPSEQNQISTEVMDNSRRAKGQEKEKTCATVQTMTLEQSVSVDTENVLLFIRDNYKKDDYIKALRYYREKTGADLETAKIALKRIFEA